MLTERLNSVIKQGEGLNREFKECKNKLSKEVFETVCAFLNRFGGELLLGVNELGSGVKKLFKYCKAYSGQNPKLIEEDIFKTIIPLPKKATMQATEQVQKLLAVCSKKALSSKELMEKLDLSHRPTFLYNYLKPALENDLIRMTEPDNPKSPKQKYIITEKGKSIIRGGKQE